MTSTGKELFQTKMLTRKCVSSINLFSVLWVTLFHAKPYCAMIRILRGLNLRLSIFYRPKITYRSFNKKSYRKNKINLQLLNKLNILQERLNGLITISKKNYYYERITNKLNNLQRNCKTYWSLLKGFLNNKKILLLSPLFHEKKFVTNFLEKAELFNSIFSKQCSLINNGSTLPTNMHYLTNNRLSSITLSQDDTAKIIQNLDSSKAHGHDNISIRMLKNNF